MSALPAGSETLTLEGCRICAAIANEVIIVE